ncbi:MAG: hypothetical protein ACTSVI_17030 [Promethearchaeota archaeon]
MIEYNKHSNFTPDFNFVRMVGEAVRSIMLHGSSRHDALMINGNKPRHDKIIGKFHEHVNSIIRYYNKVKFICDYFIETNGLHVQEGSLDYFILITLIYHYKKEEIKNDKMQSVKKVFKTSLKNEILVDKDGRKNELDWATISKRISILNVNDIICHVQNEIERTSLLHSVPTFFIKELRKLMKPNRMLNVLRCINDERYIFIKTTNKMINDGVKRKLESKNFMFRQLDQFDNVIKIYNHPGIKRMLINSDSYKQGKILIQDISSILVTDALHVKDGETIVDACAAPFQKTLILNQECNNPCRIIALEIHPTRIQKNIRRINKASRGISIINIDSQFIKNAFRNVKPDKILLDVPCTGSGALEASPELKWRQSNSFLKQNTFIQEKILDAALQWCEVNSWKDTTIVYSNCSYYPEEGEAIIDKFLNRIELINIFNERNEHASRFRNYSFGWKGYKCSKYVIRTFPEFQDCNQAFFIAKFKPKLS